MKKRPAVQYLTVDVGRLDLILFHIVVPPKHFQIVTTTENSDHCYIYNSLLFTRLSFSSKLRF